MRSIPLSVVVDDATIYLKAKPQEKYLITGFVFLGQCVDSSFFPIDLVTAGFTPIEIFLFRSSNKFFQIVKDEYRQENTEIVISFKLTDEMLASL